MSKASELVPVEFSKKFLQKLENMAAYDRAKLPTGTAHYQVYILQTEPIKARGQMQFYVGETGRTLAERINEHITGKGSKKFKQQRYGVVAERSDLNQLFPVFIFENTAKRAEGLIADKLVAMGFSAYSDQQKRRVQSRRRKKANKSR